MRGFRLKYDKWLHDSPLVTKGVTSAILFGVGDRIAQRIEGSETDDNGDKDDSADRHGLKRTARMVLWGGVLFAPIGHAWYNFLEKAVRGTTRAAVAKKIAADQLLFSPPLSLTFFTYAGVSEGKPLREAVETAVAKLPPTLAVNWTVWPLVHVCTFGFVPLEYRILFINLMRRIGELYHFWLHEAPLLTKIITAATLFGTGDRIAQRLEAKVLPHSPFEEGIWSEQSPHNEKADERSRLVSTSTARTLRMMIWGGLFAAPIMHHWFHLIERAIPGTGKLVVAKKVAADMLIIAPSTSLAFFTVTKTMEGDPVRDAFAVAKAKLPPTLLADYMLWPAANAIIFGVVPLHYRTPLTHCVSLVWSTFLSEMASHEPLRLTAPWGSDQLL
ncbi:hypothetical protein BBO99_00001955 [Phytophthora kernoviae]|uniref:Uncharacterized protein n=2 Tax=Phytophthora kernoviae TaxID=325452 RepID=A0A3R7MPG0_9STRA|nr:hypothetical protein G195_002504 [Phytophthora kernoviae 00238/432]KAG2530150.1 hypothetical protein JM16_001636 [Phytophthora kernoviae]KAG2530273.1 hypothetical protein JM18_001806 [Phytophthora kernoviae]RLN20224.1 hypothetical protein BBI17_001995 [Phytophthora kernoviae]RLN83600.1 hypothetical protein BBO99_00001955 [Phytophthora kernoviae]